MIHGACTDCDFFRETAEFLSSDYHVYTYDRSGYGRSSDPADGDHSVSAQAGEAAAIIRAIGVPCHIVAHSAGTVIAMELAAKHPELVRKVLLHEPVARNCSTAASANDLKEIRDLINSGKSTRALVRFLPRIGKKDLRARDATEEELMHMSRNNKCFIEHEFDSIFSYRADYGALLSIQISIGVGELSHGTFRWDEAHALAKRINAPMVYFPAAHNCAFDLPREFAWLTRGFLSERN